MAKVFKENRIPQEKETFKCVLDENFTPSLQTHVIPSCY